MTTCGLCPTKLGARYRCVVCVVIYVGALTQIIALQEIEIVLGEEHISFTTAKIGSLVDVSSSKSVWPGVPFGLFFDLFFLFGPLTSHFFRDPEGLKAFYYLVQDIKCLVFSLIALHFKIKPI